MCQQYLQSPKFSIKIIVHWPKTFFFAIHEWQRLIHIYQYRQIWTHQTWWKLLILNPLSTWSSHPPALSPTSTPGMLLPQRSAFRVQGTTTMLVLQMTMTMWLWPIYPAPTWPLDRQRGRWSNAGEFCQVFFHGGYICSWFICNFLFNNRVFSFTPSKITVRLRVWDCHFIKCHLFLLIFHSLA